MDPLRLTVVASLAGILLAGAFIGPYTWLAYRDYEPQAGGQVEETLSAPAAQQAFAQAFASDEARYLEQPMRMTLQVTNGAGDVWAESEARHDPTTGDHAITMMFDLAQINADHGNETYGSQQDDNATQNPFAAEFGFEEMDRFEIAFTSVGQTQVTSFGGQQWGWREYSPQDSDGFTLFPTGEDATEPGGMDDAQVPMTTRELQMVLESDDELTVHEVEADEWQGVSTWRVTSSIVNETMQGKAVFHFRQHDIAPLAVDMTLTGSFESSFDGLLEMQDPSMDPDSAPELEMHINMRFDYDDPVTIELPSGFTRLPLNPESMRTFGDDSITGSIQSSQEDPIPLEALELHVVVVDTQAAQDDPFAGPFVDDVPVKLKLGEALEATEADYELTYEDKDGSGTLSAGDRYQVVRLSDDAFWENETHRVDLLFYDPWAEAYQGAPAPAMPWVLGLIVAGLALARNRRRPRG